jgi:hypothetical protein
MSWLRAHDSICPDNVDCEPVETVIVPRASDLGDFEVRRALPAAKRQMIGPFIFFDQMGPTVFGPGQAIDVRPHPHIGLATVTWLVDGEIMHRDSLGSVQLIKPGEVNWMTAGSGIVHSERSPEDARNGGASLYGIQAWVALPKTHEEAAPTFAHYGSEDIPLVEDNGIQASLIAGAAWGQVSPVKVFTETVYADIRMNSGCDLQLPSEIEERGVYVLSGKTEIAGTTFAEGTLVALKPDREVVIRALEGSHLILLGGASIDGPRHIWWNFVSTSEERIEMAKRDWEEGRFEKVHGETEFIPLPE